VTVAWVTHHLPRTRQHEWELPDGLVGGAEMTDAAMIAAAPSDVEVHLYGPDEWEKALEADRIIITGTDLLTRDAMHALAQRKPLVWVHHQQQPSAGRHELFTAADPFVTMSEAHSQVEAAWCGVFSEWCHGLIDTSTVQPAEKQDAALWAARNHPQKGRIGARMWAQRNDVPLTEMCQEPRQVVLDAMAWHRWFVFLPKGFDSCPRTLIEAEAAGCEIVTNHLAGRRDPGEFAEVMGYQPVKFWNWL
jgi:hypothetical protein